jgi:hypothetical protein
MAKGMPGRDSQEIDAGNVVLINKPFPWFNAKLNSPSPEGWYDGRKCNARSNLRVGSRYRKKQSLSLSNVTNYQRHWRVVKGETPLQQAAGSKVFVQTS